MKTVNISVREFYLGTEDSAIACDLNMNGPEIISFDISAYDCAERCNQNDNCVAFVMVDKVNHSQIDFLCYLKPKQCLESTLNDMDHVVLYRRNQTGNPLLITTSLRNSTT